MSIKKRITVNFQDAALRDIIKDRSKSIGISQPRLIEEVLAIAMGRVTNEDDEKKLWENLPNLNLPHDANNYLDGLLSNEKLLTPMDKYITIEEGKQIITMRHITPIWKAKVEIRHPMLYLNEKGYTEVIRKHFDEIIKRMTSDYINSLNLKWHGKKPDIILLFLISAKVKCLEFNGEKLAIQVELLFHCIPLHLEWIRINNGFCYLDLLDIYYKSFKDVATRNINPKYKKYIHIELNQKTGAGGYFIGYNKIPTPIEEVINEISEMEREAKNMVRAHSTEVKSEECDLIIESSHGLLQRRSKHDFNAIKTNDIIVKLHYHRDLIKLNTMTFKRIFRGFIDKTLSQDGLKK